VQKNLHDVPLTAFQYFWGFKIVPEKSILQNK
jgi:hypothetical protein